MRPRTFAVVTLLLAACGAHHPPAAIIGHEAPATGEADEADAADAPPPAARGVSTAPLCGHPDDLIGVCAISDAGVTVQARGLTPGAAARFTLDGDYASPPAGCRPRWVRDATVDPGGVATARFDIPPSDRCRLLASMVVRVFAGPVERGPVRFGTLSPP